MVREIITDTAFLSKKCDEMWMSEGAEIHRKEVYETVKDLLDTAWHHKDRCAGLAANQISKLERIIVIKTNGQYIPLVNPEIIALTGGVQAKYETCLSRPNERPILKRRYLGVVVEYWCPVDNISKKRKFKKFDARVVQHEVDHLNGVLI